VPGACYYGEVRAGENPLARLREIRGKIRELDEQREDLVEGRDILIREASKQKVSERTIAESAGLSYGRVNQIVNRR
jgi:hypothetical protein